MSQPDRARIVCNAFSPKSFLTNKTLPLKINSNLSISPNSVKKKIRVILQSELLFDEISDAYVTTQILFQNIYGSVKQRLRFIKLIII